MSIYNLKCDGDQYRITKFDNELNVESSYLCTESECECPAGHRSTCRHRQMLPIMLNNRLQDTSGFYDFDNKQVLVPVCNEDNDPEQMPDGVEKDEALAQADEVELPYYPYAEHACPGHAASVDDPKVCAYCGTHIDSLRPDAVDEIHSSYELSEPSTIIEHDPVSSNGKTADFDSANAGSNPATGAIHPTIGKINRRI